MSNGSRDDQILTALVLILSAQLNAEAKDKGRTRVDGDYTAEAVELIKQKGPAILGLFGKRVL